MVFLSHGGSPGVNEVGVANDMLSPGLTFLVSGIPGNAEVICYTFLSTTLKGQHELTNMSPGSRD